MAFSLQLKKKESFVDFTQIDSQKLKNTLFQKITDFTDLSNHRDRHEPPTLVELSPDGAGNWKNHFNSLKKCVLKGRFCDAGHRGALMSLFQCYEDLDVPIALWKKYF